MSSSPSTREWRLDAGHVYRFGAAHRLGLDNRPDPSAALMALLDDAGALLESRTAHPGARYSYLGLAPLVELRLYPDRLLARVPGEPEFIVERDRPLGVLLEHLEALRSLPGITGAPFQGGWLGWLSHEAGAMLLDVGATAPAPPARPAGPLAVFRLCADVLVFDHRAQQAWLVARATGEGDDAVNKRLAGYKARLQAGPPASRPAEVVDEATVTLDPPAFAREQEKLQELIRDGDCFQVNLTASWAYPWCAERPDRRALAALYARYTASNPGAWCGFFPDDELTLLSGSPELLVDWEGDRLAMRPIAGTRPRGKTPGADAALADELRSDAKEQAEHAMLVDLARNDLAHVGVPASVRVPNLAGVERYRHVMHLVSEIVAAAPAELALKDLLAAVFPGGTVTGAPKRRAVTRIAECERGPRGAYTGTLGYAGFGGASQWNLLIRTLTATPTHLMAHAGCGIVAASETGREADELGFKARAQIESALGQGTAASAADRCGDVEPGRPWRPGRGNPASQPAEVLIVDFEDSFVHNLADYAAALGAQVRVVSIHDAPEPAWAAPVTHLILSPGPGEPSDFPAWRTHLAQAEERGLPVLGICLGHQALAEADGARVVRHAEAMHGRWSDLVRTPAAAADPLLGRWPGTRVGRYHSLVVTGGTDNMVPLAMLEDDTLMAVRYRNRPHWGLQFHPESLLTEDGMDLMRAFLEIAP